MNLQNSHQGIQDLIIIKKKYWSFPYHDNRSNIGVSNHRRHSATAHQTFDWSIMRRILISNCSVRHPMPLIGQCYVTTPRLYAVHALLWLTYTVIWLLNSRLCVTSSLIGRWYPTWPLIGRLSQCLPLIGRCSQALLARWVPTTMHSCSDG